MPFERTHQNIKHETIVVGGGLAGLAAATYLARAGRPVTVLEKSEYAGGRARTQQRDGFSFNLGPHALFRNGEAMAVLKELGVNIDGATPPNSGAYTWFNGTLHTMPSGIVSLLTTGLLRPTEKVELARSFATLQACDLAPLQTVTLAAWLHAHVTSPTVRSFLAGLMRVASYADEPEIASAGAALQQFRRAFAGGVLYLNGGWQSLIQQLRQQAITAGARIVPGASVKRLRYDDRVRGVILANGTEVAASTVLIAANPETASDLLGAPIANTKPIFASCLDVALSRLPRSNAVFALGLDQPLYASVHSASAKLAPAGGALIHVAQYVGLRGETADQVRERLETLLDSLQPGWRSALQHARFLPNLTVSNAVVTAAQGGLAGRPSVQLSDVLGVYLAGDWVGSEGMLADASLASARRAANAILQHAAEPQPEALCLAQ